MSSNNKHQDSLKTKLNALKQLHTSLRYQLELAIETTPRDSRYSQGLIDMMQKEEAMIREGKTSPDFGRKVDEALRLETSSFFAKASQPNAKKWTTLQIRMDHEREQLKSEISQTTHTPNYQEKPVSHLIPDISQLDMEELRLEQIYNDRWFEFEGYTLQQAFESQKLRIDTEWDAHLNNLQETYKMKRRVLNSSKEESTIPTLPGNKSSTSGQDSRWHQPEKQKTLFNTAPVLSPSPVTAKERPIGSAIRAVRGKGSVDSGAIQAELDRLDQQYQSAVEVMATQKSQAMRWMNRQKVRIMAHADSVQTERRAIGAVLRQEVLDINCMLDILSEVLSRNSSGHQSHRVAQAQQPLSIGGGLQDQTSGSIGIMNNSAKLMTSSSSTLSGLTSSPQMSSSTMFLRKR